MEEENSDEEQEDDGEDMDEGPSLMDTTEGAVKRGRTYLNQNERLYDAEGIQNPHAKRAQKKLKKKAAKAAPALSDDSKASDDYDFNTDYIEDKSTADDPEDDNEDAMQGIN